MNLRFNPSLDASLLSRSGGFRDFLVEEDRPSLEVGTITIDNSMDSEIYSEVLRDVSDQAGLRGYGTIKFGNRNGAVVLCYKSGRQEQDA